MDNHVNKWGFQKRDGNCKKESNEKARNKTQKQR